MVVSVFCVVLRSDKSTVATLLCRQRRQITVFQQYILQVPFMVDRRHDLMRFWFSPPVHVCQRVGAPRAAHQQHFPSATIRNFHELRESLPQPARRKSVEPAGLIRYSFRPKWYWRKLRRQGKGWLYDFVENSVEVVRLTCIVDCLEKEWAKVKILTVQPKAVQVSLSHGLRLADCKRQKTKARGRQKHVVREV